MLGIQRAFVQVMMTTWLAVLAMPCVAAPKTTERQALVKTDAAQHELQNGRPEAFKALWSHADDVTLSGGFGGTIEKGWEQVGRRLDWVGAQFSNGTNTIERIVAKANGAIGYLYRLSASAFKFQGRRTSRRGITGSRCCSGANLRVGESFIAMQIHR